MSTVAVSRLIEKMSLENLTPDIDVKNRKITIPDINRPALQLAGYLEHYDATRVQVIGFVEATYMEGLSPDVKKERYEHVLSHSTPCFVFCREIKPDPFFVEVAREKGVPILVTKRATSDFMAEIIRWLNVKLAPCISVHGVLVDVYGEGVLITGESGIGKSEAALELIKRGHRLVTDDVVDIYTEIREKMDTPVMRSLVVKGFNDHEEHLGVLIDQIKYVDDLIKNHPNEVQEMMLKDEELEYVRPDDRLRVWREHEIMNRSGLGSLALSWQSFIIHQIGSHEFTAAAIQDGYDGVIVGRGNDYKEYVVFEANQIKSATYNVGTFNLNSNDIRFHFIGEEGARQLDQNLGGNYNSFLEKAKYCENMGYAPHYIKFVTGWEKGIDGKWRYELGGIRDFNPFQIKRSAGVGVRIFLPMVGLLGVDWGYGFDDPTHGGSQFHFVIGQQF